MRTDIMHAEKPSMSSAMRTTICLFVLTLAMTSSALGQGTPLQERLSRTKRVTCTFSVMTTGTWNNGTPSGTSANASYKVDYRNINIDEGTADADAGFGGGFIVVRYSGDYLHLMQIQSAGPLYTTTVFAKETKEGRLMAVHTRHEYTDVRLPGFTSRPEMYLGECAISE